MEKGRKEVTMEELVKFMQSQDGEFLIRVELEEEEAYGEGETVLA